MSGREHGHDPLLPHGAQAVAAPPRPTDDLEVVPGFEHENLQGWIPQLATEADIRAVIEKAFDYRGDVTITRKNKDDDKNKDGSQITGYLFDRRIAPTLESSVVRLILATGELGKKILGKAGERREEYFHRARSAGVKVRVGRVGTGASPVQAKRSSAAAVITASLHSL